MKYNPIIKHRLDAIKNEQLRKDCWAVLYALSVGASPSLFYNAKEALNTLNKLGFVDTSTEPISVSIHMFLDVPKKNQTLFEETEAEKVIKARIKEYRDLFRGYRVGSMGDEGACIIKMTRFMNSNPDVTFEQILAAAQYYIHRLKDPQFITQADYFIYKQNAKREEVSKLKSILEEIDFTQQGVDPWQHTL